MNAAMQQRTRLDRFLDHVDWNRVCHLSKQTALVAISFALGGWVVSIRDKAAQLPYKTTATRTLETLERASGGDPSKLLDCARKSSKAVQVARQAIVSNYNPAVPVPRLAEVPDCDKRPVLHPN